MTDGGWHSAPDAYGDADRFELPTLTAAVSIAELYDDILDPSGRSLLR